MFVRELGNIMLVKSQFTKAPKPIDRIPEFIVNTDREEFSNILAGTLVIPVPNVALTILPQPEHIPEPPSVKATLFGIAMLRN
jgi:hypothetical protein